jgi:hypothetical protein
MLFPDQDKVDEISAIVTSATQNNLGDVFAEAIRIRNKIKDQPALGFSEIPLKQLREMASRAPIGCPLFANPIMPSKALTDNEILQLIGLEMSLHELGYCCDRLQEAADITSGSSSPTRFYLNGIYYYLASLFLLDKSEASRKGLSMGGTVIRALHPMGLSTLLVPIDAILNRPLGKENTVGEAIRKLRNSQLVHGDFSPKQLEALVVDTEMRDPIQKERLAANIWDLFHEVLFLDLRITAILTKLNPDIPAIVTRYAASH